MSFYDNFVKICRARGESPSHAVEAAGLSRSMLSKFVKYPDRVPSGETAKKLVDYFGCSYEDLFSTPKFRRSEAAVKIQMLVDRMEECDQVKLLRLIQFMQENRE